MLEVVAQQAAHLEAIAYQVATALWYPVLVIEIVLLALVVVDTGIFTAEVINRRRNRRSVPAIQSAAADARTQLFAGRKAEAAAALATLRHGMYVVAFGRSIVADPDFRPVNLMKQVTDLEFAVMKRLDRTRLMIRLGPILGLITTLIPISPALVGLARGDIKTLSDNLVVAFSTTVVGLLIGALGYVLTAARDRYYSQDVSDVEYALELMEV